MLVVAGALGLLSAQLAFQAGPLASSLPVTASIDPLASVALALAVFHERLRDHPLDITLSVAALAVMAYTVARLSLVRAQLEDAPAAHEPGGTLAGVTSQAQAQRVAARRAVFLVLGYSEKISTKDHGRQDGDVAHDERDPDCPSGGDQQSTIQRRSTPIPVHGGLSLAVLAATSPVPSYKG